MWYRWCPWRRRPAPPNERPRPRENEASRVVRPAANIYRAPSLASATREYARRLEGGTFERLSARERESLFLGMGPEIWAWQYAKRLTMQSPWRAHPGTDAAIERKRASRLMLADVETWERALLELDAEIDRSRLRGKDAPAPLDVPAEVAALMEARRAAALRKATRRRPRSGDGHSDVVGSPGEAVPRPPVTRGPA